MPALLGRACKFSERRSTSVHVAKLSTSAAATVVTPVQQARYLHNYAPLGQFMPVRLLT